MSDELLGKLFADRFRVEEVLGVGGMGTVYLAQHEVLERPVALKVIRADLANSEELLPRFRREARAASRVDHPHVTYILDFGETEEGRSYMAMEYVEGPTLAHALFREGPFSVSRATAILEQIAQALVAAHACNVIHRDLKPRNIVLTEHSGQPDFVKVLDFGLAKIVDLKSTSVITPLGHTFGTPEYISPEQAADLPVDHRADIYSLGVVAYELLTGQVPFAGNTSEVVTAHVNRVPLPPSSASGRVDIPPELDRIVQRCLEKKPEDRFQSAADLAAALARI